MEDAGDDLLYDGDDEQRRKNRKLIEDIEECCAMLDKEETFKPAIEEKLAQLVDQFHSTDIARLTPHGLSEIGDKVCFYSFDFYMDITYAMLYKNDNRPDRYIPSPPKEPEMPREETVEKIKDPLEDFDFSGLPYDPVYEYEMQLERQTDEFFNVALGAIKTLAAEHYPGEIMTLSAEGYRFLDERIFEITDEFVVAVADLIYKDIFADRYLQLKIYALGRSFTLPHCRPERLTPLELAELSS